MFFLHASNRTENLLQHLAALIKVDERRDIFAKEYILLQSQGMERMVSQFLADTFISWCNFEYLLPLAFLQVIAEKLDMVIVPDSYDRRFLCWRIEDQLRQLDSDVYAPLHHYLQGNDVDLKRYQLARRLADIFDQYQLMRPQMLDAWQKGLAVTGDPAEIWQMSLWNRLAADESLGEHRGRLLQRVISRLHQEDAIDRLPRRVSVFGLHIMPPLFLDYLHGMSRHCDVHLFLLSPCRQYWGDMRHGRGGFPSPQTAIQGEAMTAAGVARHHPLLLSLGMQGRVFQDMILDQINVEKEITSYDEPFSKEEPLLLHRLQSDILAGELGTNAFDWQNDTSVQIVSCHSRQRELAILKDHILDFLHTDKSLQLGDIVVMAPDIQDYAAFIPAFFEDIQHSIADRSLHRSNVFIAVFSQFLALFSGRFGWSEVLALLQKEQIYSHFIKGAADFELLQHWVIAAGVRWGLSGRSRRSEGFEFSENSWGAGLHRLLMGYLIDGDSPVAGVLPYNDIEGKEAADLGGLCEFVSLIESASQRFQHSYSLKDWSGLFGDIAGQLFGQPEEDGFLDLRKLILQLDDYGNLHSGMVAFAPLCNWFQSSAAESRSASGFLRGYLTFCSMLPMRSIPFKVVCMIGMHHGTFPKSDNHTTFDLMRLHPLPGDRSLRADDRYQFLEAILSARQSLYISYIGQSLQNNDSIPPSVVVTELLETLADAYGLKDIVVKHPLHPFSPRYFTEDSSRLFSYSQENFHIAERVHQPSKAMPGWWTGTTQVEKKEVDIADLLRFYRNPQLYFVQHILGIRLSGDLELPDECEAFAVKGLDSFIINHQILAKIDMGEDIEAFHKRLCEDGRWPLGAPGRLVFSEKEEVMLRFAGNISAHKMGLKLADAEINLDIGGYHLYGKLSNIHEGGILIAKYTDLNGKDLLGGWLHHVLGQAQGLLKPYTVMVMRDRDVIFDHHDRLVPGLEELLVHYELGCRQPSKFYVEPASEYSRQTLRASVTVTPLQKAEGVFRASVENGYEPAWSLLCRNRGDAAVLDDDFTRISERIMMPLWSYLNES